MTKFEIGKSYTMRSACDHECTWTYTVTGRTACTITLKDEYGKETKHRISKLYSEHRKAETILPLGNYSMCPMLSAI